MFDIKIGDLFVHTKTNKEFILEETHSKEKIVKGGFVIETQYRLRPKVADPVRMRKKDE